MTLRDRHSPRPSARISADLAPLRGEAALGSARAEL
jgi:hypothetical protein